jgi:hypothetical protein
MLRTITISIALAVARPVHADCDAARATLAADAARADQWNLGWSLGFTGAAIGQAALALTPVSRDNRDALLVGAAKSTIGAASHWILPLRIATPTSCDDARAILRRTRREERQLFYLGHIGGFVLNAAAAIFLAELTTWKNGLLSFAIGYPVGLANTYTMPRGSWHAAMVPVDGGVAVVVGSSF